jgi:hypothetical protein
VAQKTSPAKAAAQAKVKQSASARVAPAEAVEAESSQPPLKRPASVTAVAILTATIAAAMVGYAAYLIIGGFVGQPVLRGRAEVAGVIFLLFGIGIAWVSRGLGRLEPWARTPALLTQLLLVGSAYRMFQDSLYLEGALVGLYGLAGVVLLFVPASHKVLSRDVR